MSETARSTMDLATLSCSVTVDAASHAIVAAEVSLEMVDDNEVLPTRLPPFAPQDRTSQRRWLPMTQKPVMPLQQGHLTKTMYSNEINDCLTKQC